MLLNKKHKRNRIRFRTDGFFNAAVTVRKRELFESCLEFGVHREFTIGMQRKCYGRIAFSVEDVQRETYHVL